MAGLGIAQSQLTMIIRTPGKQAAVESETQGRLIIVDGFVVILPMADLDKGPLKE
jgi:hypothetical protein